MEKKSITRTLFKNPDNTKLISCPVCGTPQFDKLTFPGTYDICSICLWHDDTEQYYDQDLEGSPNEPSLNQARENYMHHGITDLTLLDTIRQSLILGLIYGFKLNWKKSELDRIGQDKTLWNYLRYELIFRLFFPNLPYDNLNRLKTLTNKFYEEEEVLALNKFAIAFKEFIERVGIEQPDEVYTNDQEWDNLQKQAADLVELMQKNNHKYHFDKPYIPKQISFTPL